MCSCSLFSIFTNGSKLRMVVLVAFVETAPLLDVMPSDRTSLSSSLLSKLSLDKGATGIADKCCCHGNNNAGCSGSFWLPPTNCSAVVPSSDDVSMPQKPTLAGAGWRCHGRGLTPPIQVWHRGRVGAHKGTTQSHHLTGSCGCVKARLLFEHTHQNGYRNCQCQQLFGTFTTMGTGTIGSGSVVILTTGHATTATTRISDM